MQGILMSKIGKKNILIPKESSIKIDGSNLTITGPKGTKKLTINDKILWFAKIHLALFARFLTIALKNTNHKWEVWHLAK